VESVVIVVCVVLQLPLYFCFCYRVYFLAGVELVEPPVVPIAKRGDVQVGGFVVRDLPVHISELTLCHSIRNNCVYGDRKDCNGSLCRGHAGGGRIQT
jgi:hypothetical protein